MVACLRSASAVGLDGADVVVDRELDVHVQHPALREQEGHVGDAAAGHARLAPVVDALDEPGHAQHVVGHALAPLAPGLRVGQHLAQAVGGLGQVARLLGGLGEPGGELAVLGRSLLLETGDQIGDPVETFGEPGREAGDLVLDHLVAQVELLVGGGGLGAELVGGHAQHQVDGLLGGRLALGDERLTGHLERGVTVGRRRGAVGRGRPANGASDGHGDDRADGETADQAHEQRVDLHVIDPTQGV